MSASAVAVGWSEYVVNLLGDWGIHLPDGADQRAARQGRGQFPGDDRRDRQPARSADRAGARLGAVHRHARNRRRRTTSWSWIKVAVIVVFVLAGVSFIDTANWAALPAGEHGHGRRVRRERPAARHGDHLLLLRRLRCGIDHGARDAQSAARRAARHPRRAGHFGRALHRDGGRHDRHGAVHRSSAPTRRSQSRSTRIRSWRGSARS